MTLLVGFLVAGTAASLMQVVLLGRLADRIVLTARETLIRRFFRAKLEQVQRFRTGELVTRVTSDTVLLREAATSSLVGLVNGLVSLIGTIALMAFLDWPLLATTLIALAIVGALFAVFVPPGAPVLALRGVTARYRGSEGLAIDGLTLEIPRSGHVALVGPSGAGKTTVLSLLLRFIEPTAGRLELDGAPFAELSIDDVRSRIAYVEQDAPIALGTIRENVLFRVDTAALELGARYSGAHDPGARGLDDEAWQALAAVLLDEATAQLDGVTEAAIQRAIAGAASVGAVVTIAHRLSTVLDADQIFVLEAGRLRASGTHDELLGRDELYREFVAALRIGAAISAG